MSIRRLVAVARKEFRHITRDVRTFFLVTVAPAFLLVTLSYVFSFDVDRVDIAVRDLDHTPSSRAFLADLTADGDIVVVAYVERGEETELLFTRDVTDLVLVIPHGFADAVLGGSPAEVQCVVDGADAITAYNTIGLLESRVNAFAANIAGLRAQRSWHQLQDVGQDILQLHVHARIGTDEHVVHDHQGVPQLITSAGLLQIHKLGHSQGRCRRGRRAVAAIQPLPGRL